MTARASLSRPRPAARSGPERDVAEREAGRAAEMERMAILLRALHLHRAGETVGSELKQELAAVQQRVEHSRATPFWRGLLPEGFAPELETLAFDVIAASLLPVLRPSALHLLVSLGALHDGMTQALLHELVMASAAEEEQLDRLLSPVSPLRSTRLVVVEGEGPARRIRPGSPLMRLLQPDHPFGELPAGVRLVTHHAPPTGAIYSGRIRSQIDEVVALSQYQSREDAAGRRGGPGGPAVLFTGGPGTGKSLAAREIAQRLGQPLFQLNLASTVSKWVGETEKNMSRVFEQMSGTPGCIVIDEADSILSKRVTVKEGRDQYANLTVSHLLTLIEMHRGLVMLTTNLRQNLDDAYLRRIALIVEFAAPGPELRRSMLLNALAHTGLSPERESLAGLASAIDLTGAEIGNAVRLAAALAHAAGSTITPHHLARAVWREKTKAAMTFSRSDLRGLANYLEPLT